MHISFSAMRKEPLAGMAGLILHVSWDPDRFKFKIPFFRTEIESRGMPGTRFHAARRSAQNAPPEIAAITPFPLAAVGEAGDPILNTNLYLAVSSAGADWQRQRR
jgi:hypothetical protein